MNDNTRAAKVVDPFAFFPYFISMKNISPELAASKNENNNI